MNITEQTSTDYMARGELPPWVDLDKLWPAELRAEVAAVIDEGMGWVDPDGPFMAWRDRAGAVIEKVTTAIDTQGLYNIEGDLRKLIDASINYDTLVAIMAVLGWDDDPATTWTPEWVETCRQTIAERLDR